MFHGPHDHRVFGARDVIADQELLEQLLRGSQARELDLDVAVRIALVSYGEPREVDHAAREVRNADRLAHVEHEHVAALRHRTRLQEELGRLRYGHEVADDVGMCGGGGFTARYLVAGE